MKRFTLMTILLSIACQSTVFAQTAVDQTLDDPEPVIEATSNIPDAEIKSRIQRIFDEIDVLANIKVDVSEGVVSLSGSVSNEAQAQMARRLAIRIESVVTVKDQIDRSLDIEGNVAPIIDSAKTKTRQLTRALPLIALSFFVFFLIALLGHLLAKWNGLWQRISPNSFLAELMSQAVRIIFFISGLVVALNLLGATALMGTILGSAGVIGLAIGFAVRDSMENYISSIMLSLRQPFRSKDHVVINEHEGIVVRLTSRATILMTLSGNHLRIPNSTVFKGVIQNYTTNPERRFDFTLGVDAADDPVAAIRVGLKAISELDFVLKDPKPNAVINHVGDSSIVISYMGWVNQTVTNFGSARSLAISSATKVLEAQGFTLPEPIYRLRFDQPLPNAELKVTSQTKTDLAPPAPPVKAKPKASSDTETMDVRPETHLTEKVEEEQAELGSNDLLDDDRPAE